MIINILQVFMLQPRKPLLALVHLNHYSSACID